MLKFAMVSVSVKFIDSAMINVTGVVIGIVIVLLLWLLVLLLLLVVCCGC